MNYILMTGSATQEATTSRANLLESRKCWRNLIKKII